MGEEWYPEPKNLVSERRANGNGVEEGERRPEYVDSRISKRRLTTSGGRFSTVPKHLTDFRAAFYVV